MVSWNWRMVKYDGCTRCANVSFPNHHQNPLAWIIQSQWLHCSCASALMQKNWILNYCSLHSAFVQWDVIWSISTAFDRSQSHLCCTFIVCHSSCFLNCLLFPFQDAASCLFMSICPSSLEIKTFPLMTGYFFIQYNFSLVVIKNWAPKSHYV